MNFKLIYTALVVLLHCGIVFSQDSADPGDQTSFNLKQADSLWKNGQKNHAAWLLINAYGSNQLMTKKEAAQLTQGVEDLEGLFTEAYHKYIIEDKECNEHINKRWQCYYQKSLWTEALIQFLRGPQVYYSIINTSDWQIIDGNSFWDSEVKRLIATNKLMLKVPKAYNIDTSHTNLPSDYSLKLNRGNFEIEVEIRPVKKLMDGYAGSAMKNKERYDIYSMAEFWMQLSLSKVTNDLSVKAFESESASQFNCHWMSDSFCRSDKSAKYKWSYLVGMLNKNSCCVYLRIKGNDFVEFPQVVNELINMVKFY